MFVDFCLRSNVWEGGVKRQDLSNALSQPSGGIQKPDLRSVLRISLKVAHSHWRSWLLAS